MLRGLYTAYTGMRAQQYRMDVISNNIANTNTIGFKKDNVAFETFNQALMLKINDPERPGVQGIGTVNFGSQLGKIYTSFEQGTLQETDNPYNVALQGKGFIAVGKMDAQGNLVTKYTRDGAFTVNAQGNLVTKDGYFVLGENGPITLENGTLHISEAGEIFVEGNRIDKLQLVDFSNPETLDKLAGGIYEAKDGTNITEFRGTVIQGFVEGSNVNSIDEMVNMINVMRSYESGQKVITTYDTTLEKAVNEVGRV